MPTDGSGEREILIKAVRVNTLSKLTYGDTRQFLALIGDVFPGAESSDIPGVRKARRGVLVTSTLSMDSSRLLFDLAGRCEPFWRAVALIVGLFLIDRLVLSRPRATG